MAVTETPAGAIGSKAPAFSLAGVDGRIRSLNDCRGERGTLVMFICNHCPYVKAILDRLILDCEALCALGVASVAIMPNDSDAYPADNLANMRALAEQKNLPFPYLIDKSQAVARAYGAVCTPDFFGFDAELRLKYRGRLDAQGLRPADDHTRRELFEAMRDIAEQGSTAAIQHPSIGCSIKWRTAGK